MAESSRQRTHPDMWVDPEDDPRRTGQPTTGEKAVVLEYLDHYRMTLEMKCEDLDTEQLACRSVPPSTLSLLGLVRHLAQVEHRWYRAVLGGQPDLPRLYDRSGEEDWAFDGAVGTDACVTEAWSSWRREVAHAREMEAGLDLGATVEHRQTLEVRDVLVHLVEEYARHLGHADLLRECIDGRTGQ